MHTSIVNYNRSIRCLEVRFIAKENRDYHVTLKDWDPQRKNVKALKVLETSFRP